MPMADGYEAAGRVGRKACLGNGARPALGFSLPNAADGYFASCPLCARSVQSQINLIRCLLLTISTGHPAGTSSAPPPGRRRTRRWRSHPGRRGRHTRWRRRGHPWGWRRRGHRGGGGAAILGGGDGAAIRGGGAAIRGGGGRSDAGCRRRGPCHMHRRRRRGSPQFRLQLRSWRNRSGGLWRRGGAGWRDCDLAGPETPGLGWPTGAAGAVAPIAGLEPGAAPGAVGAADPGGGAPGLAFGLTAPGDTRSARRRGWRAPGAGNRQGVGPRQGLGRRQRARRIGRLRRVRPSGLPRGAPGKPALAAGLIAALGGTGALPCWISVALCATAGGSVGVAPPCPGATGGAGASDRLGAKSAARPGTRTVPARTRLRRPVDDVVDDGPVVDVGKDDVVRRRRHIARRPAHRPVSARRSAAAG